MNADAATQRNDAPCGKGELLWPVALVDQQVIDLSQVTALGTWAYAGFARGRSGRLWEPARPSSGS